ncbi:hypothetical protein V3851_18405 [Paenibacillus sp. M1]|uniref:Uncharacterized protein n=1 Tax=Paenibacillus haidiansis TaxID=1574488 RepID=A0ABU7VVL5_9BACL
MEKYESDLTRRFLLNSHSRGSLDEVVGEDDMVEFASEALFVGEENDSVDQQFIKEWDGKEITWRYFNQSYE